jgi:alpha,alpha-trehalose-phosphate synthase [UDP-forming]
MGLEVPSWAAEMFHILTGDAWPEADEDEINDLAQLWFSIGAELVRFAPEVTRSAQYLADSGALVGEAQKALAAAVAVVTGDGDLTLEKLAAGFEELGQYLHRVALQTQYMKIIVIEELIILAAQIVYLIAMMPWTFGASAAGIAALQIFGRQFAMAVMRQLAIAIATGEVLQVGLDAIAQLAQMAQGRRKSGEWDWGLTTSASVTGVVGGVLGPVFELLGHLPAKWLAKKIGHNLADVGSRMLEGAGHEYLTDGVSGFVQNGSWNPDTFSPAAGAFDEGTTAAARIGRRKRAARAGSNPKVPSLDTTVNPLALPGQIMTAHGAGSQLSVPSAPTSLPDRADSPIPSRAGSPPAAMGNVGGPASNTDQILRGLDPQPAITSDVGCTEPELRTPPMSWFRRTLTTTWLHSTDHAGVDPVRATTSIGPAAESFPACSQPPVTRPLSPWQEFEPHRTELQHRDRLETAETADMPALPPVNGAFADQSPHGTPGSGTPAGVSSLVVVANRMPVSRQGNPDGTISWRPSPGGLVTALEPVLRREGGAWVGWTGDTTDAPGEFDSNGIHLVPIGMDADEVTRFYEGMSNGTLWPLYHDAIVPPAYHRSWWEAYVSVNQRFAEAAAAHAAPGGTVWVQDYQLQLAPRMLRQIRPDLTIGFFDHIPFPKYEIFAQLPWHRDVLEGLLGADLLGFQVSSDAEHFLRACERIGLPTAAGAGPVVDRSRPDHLGVTSGGRIVHTAAFPISIDSQMFETIAHRPEVQARARQIRAELGDPNLVLLGVDRLDYTKGIPHRLQAFGELLDEGHLTVPEAVFVQVAVPSRQRVPQYQILQDQVETVVTRINEKHGRIDRPAVRYLRESQGQEELVALYQAADIMLVTSLRDGMNLVAKEYVAARIDEGGRLVLSTFAGAASELTQAYLVDPHKIDELKATILAAASADHQEASRRMRALRRQVLESDVARWATNFLQALGRTRVRDVGGTARLSDQGVPQPGRRPGSWAFAGHAAWSTAPSTTGNPQLRRRIRVLSRHSPGDLGDCGVLSEALVRVGGCNGVPGSPVGAR